MPSHNFSLPFLVKLNIYWQQASLLAAHRTYLYDNPLFKPSHEPLVFF